MLFDFFDRGTKFYVAKGFELWVFDSDTLERIAYHNFLSLPSTTRKQSPIDSSKKVADKVSDTTKKRKSRKDDASLGTTTQKSTSGSQSSSSVTDADVDAESDTEQDTPTSNSNDVPLLSTTPVVPAISGGIVLIEPQQTTIYQDSAPDIKFALVIIPPDIKVGSQSSQSSTVNTKMFGSTHVWIWSATSLKKHKYTFISPIKGLRYLDDHLAVVRETEINIVNFNNSGGIKYIRAITTCKNDLGLADIARCPPKSRFSTTVSINNTVGSVGSVGSQGSRQSNWSLDTSSTTSSSITVASNATHLIQKSNRQDVKDLKGLTEHTPTQNTGEEMYIVCPGTKMGQICVQPICVASTVGSSLLDHHQHDLVALKFDPSGQLVVSASTQGTRIVVHNLIYNTTSIFRRGNSMSTISSLTFHPIKNLLGVASKEKSTIHFFSLDHLMAKVPNVVNNNASSQPNQAQTTKTDLIFSSPPKSSPVGDSTSKTITVSAVESETTPIPVPVSTTTNTTSTAAVSAPTKYSNFGSAFGWFSALSEYAGSEWSFAKYTIPSPPPAIATVPTTPTPAPVATSKNTKISFLPIYKPACVILTHNELFYRVVLEDNGKCVQDKHDKISNKF